VRSPPPSLDKREDTKGGLPLRIRDAVLTPRKNVYLEAATEDAVE
jgi:hypothetical protein